MQEFPGNSQKAKARSDTPPPVENPKIERVTTAEAVQRKRGLGRKFRETFVIGSMQDAADYMITEVVVPAVKETIVDALQGGIERLFNGESPRHRRTTPSAYPSTPYINYSSKSKPAPAPPTRMLSRRSRMMHDFGEIIIDSRGEAQDVLEMMYEILSRQGEVSIADLYVLVGIQGSHVDQRFGWTSLQGAKLKRTRTNQFVLDLPDPVALD